VPKPSQGKPWVVGGVLGAPRAVCTRLLLLAHSGAAQHDVTRFIWMQSAACMTKYFGMSRGRNQWSNHQGHRENQTTQTTADDKNFRIFYQFFFTADLILIRPRNDIQTEC